jgi:hypothetical protein
MFKKANCVIAGIMVAATMAQAASSVFEMPQIFPKHVQLRQQLIQTVRAGRTDEMERVCREGVALMPDDSTWQYNLACALAYRADKREALAALERAIELGFRDPAAIRADNDLKQLSAQPEFAALVEKAEALRGKPVAGVTPVDATTVFMGSPAEIHGSNTVWDFDAGCFKTLFALRNAELRKVSSYAAEYRGPASALIGGWMREESASGNFGDLYVNRDGGHSALAVSNFPGMTPVVYGAEARLHKIDMSHPNALFDQPVLGNSSMSMVNGPFWRSLPRAILTDPFQPILALRMYLGNQCWFYPEHKDYDPETGDLYPANTPYYVISQGSSSSDQPFMEAFAAAMAAFQPDVKRELATRKWLAPTLQMLFRASQKTLKTPEDYLTGAAHPVVFDSQNLDVEGMARRAHALKPGAVPPPVALRTVRDAQAEMGVDYFDLRAEALFDTPFAIARVVRGVALRRSMTLEAAAPLNPDETAFRWVVLQGDPAKIEIKQLTSNASRVELTVAYHGQYRPKGADGLPAPIQSSRVDIGCFVKVGDLWSAPSFVSFYCLPSETRVYRDDGRILSVDYSNAAHQYADPALTIQKGWKDLYEYDGQGRLLGWYRTRAGGQPERFTWHGHKVLATDAKNRPTQACAVEYLPRQTGVAGMPPTLSCADTQKRFDYTYADDQDQVGKAAPVK